MKSLIVGMGFGQLYKDVLTQMGHEVVTVDRDQTKKADFIELTTALAPLHFMTRAYCDLPPKGMLGKAGAAKSNSVVLRIPVKYQSLDMK